jgi:hypothetical protein
MPCSEEHWNEIERADRFAAQAALAVPEFFIRCTRQLDAVRASATDQVDAIRRLFELQRQEPEPESEGPRKRTDPNKTGRETIKDHVAQMFPDEASTALNRIRTSGTRTVCLEA